MSVKGSPEKGGACVVGQGVSRKSGPHVSLFRGLPENAGRTFRQGGSRNAGSVSLVKGFSENAGGMFRRSRDFQKKRDACFVGQRQFARQRTPTKKTCTKKYKAEVHHREKKKFGRRYRMPGFEGIPYT